MNKFNRILQHPMFGKYMEANAVKEAERIFCRHNMAHVLDVARIAYILNVEEAYGLFKEMIYAAALLHDIGRHVQYETGEKHAFVSARLAKAILVDCGFGEEEMEDIISAIYTHSDKDIIQDKTLNGLIARADQLSRACYACLAADQCNWSNDRKNNTLQW